MNRATSFLISLLFLGILGHTPVQAEICLTLGDALQRASNVNLKVVMANARLEQAIARMGQARSDLLPHVEGDVDGSRQTEDLRAEGINFPGFGPKVGPFNSFDARARVTMSLLDPSAFARFQAARKGKSLSDADLQKTKEDMLAVVANLYVDAERKDQTFKLIKILLARDQMSSTIAQDNFTQGLGTELEANQSTAALTQTKYLYTQAKQQAHDALLDLEAALQMPLGKSLVFLDDKVLYRTFRTQSGTNFDHAGNADMLDAQSELDARKADEKTADAGFLPTVSGSADYGRSGISPSDSSNTYSVGVKASIPIWEGGAQQAQLAEAKGEVKEAQANLLDASQQQEVDIEKARDAIAESEDLKKARTEDRLTAQRSLRIAFHAQETGSGSVLDLMKAKADLANTEDQYNEAQASWIMAYIDLFHAQGRLRVLVK